MHKYKSISFENPAIFKAYFNTNETLFTLMLNYVAMQIVTFCIVYWENPRHNTTCKFIDDQYFAILNHIVLITEHQIIGAKSQCHNMLDLKVISISQIVQMKILLYLLDTLFCQNNMFLFFIDNEITGPCEQDQKQWLIKQQF